jgi:hypothetical protein
MVRGETCTENPNAERLPVASTSGRLPGGNESVSGLRDVEMENLNIGWLFLIEN